MKKFLVLATAALFLSGAAFAGKGKKCAKESCCKEKKESCCKDKKAKTAKTTATKPAA